MNPREVNPRAAQQAAPAVSAVPQPLAPPVAAVPPVAAAPRVPTTMRAVTCRRYGPPDVLCVEDLPVPSPRAGEVLLRVGAVSVSRADAAMRAADPAVARLAAGLRRPRHPVLGAELAGEVVAVGPDVSGVAVGDRLVGATGVAQGGYAEYARVPVAGTVRVPIGMSDAEVVALVEGGLTALPFLRDGGRVGARSAVCVNGAAGAVGAAAVQVAVALGAEVTAVCSAAGADLARSLGARVVVDREVEDVTSGGARFDVLLDAVGTLSLWRARRALRPGGIYLSTVPSPGILWHTLTAAVPGRRRRGRILFTGLRPAAAKAEDQTELLELAAAGRLRPVLTGTYPLEDAVAAHTLVDSGRKQGTVVLTPARTPGGAA